MRRPIFCALIPLAAVHAIILFAGFFAPYAPDRQNRDFPFAPPTRIRFIEDDGTVHLRPFVYRLRVEDNGYVEDRSIMLPLRVLVSGDRYVLNGLWFTRIHLFGVQAPGAVFLMGTDDYGRDQFSRFLWGARISMLAGLGAACLTLAIGGVLGALSGFYGNTIDDVVMAVAELFLALPWFYLLIGARATLPLQLEPGRAFFLLVALLGGGAHVVASNLSCKVRPHR